jgi:hypothetical protein
MVYLLAFHAYEYTCINEMHDSRRKLPSKNLVRQLCADGFNSGVKGLICNHSVSLNNSLLTAEKVRCSS